MASGKISNSNGAKPPKKPFQGGSGSPKVQQVRGMNRTPKGGNSGSAPLVEQKPGARGYAQAPVGKRATNKTNTGNVVPGH